jgi:hypothetical protein
MTIKVLLIVKKLFFPLGSACTLPCPGNASQICGSYYTDSRLEPVKKYFMYGNLQSDLILLIFVMFFNCDLLYCLLSDIPYTIVVTVPSSILTKMPNIYLVFMDMFNMFTFHFLIVSVYIYTIP